MGNRPVRVGVPDKVPSAASNRPAGSVPEAMLKVVEPSPPVCVNTWLKATSVVAVVTDGLVIVIVGTRPVPESKRSTGLLKVPSLPLTRSTALRVPPRFGVKVMVKVAVPPALMVLLLAGFTVKSPGFAPALMKAFSVMLSVPVLVMV